MLGKHIEEASMFHAYKNRILALSRQIDSTTTLSLKLPDTG
jgi:hypothetical protein